MATGDRTVFVTCEVRLKGGSGVKVKDFERRSAIKERRTALYLDGNRMEVVGVEANLSGRGKP
jgi:hypothetical protein